MTTTHTPFTLGSVSTGTLRAEDLLPAFTNALADLEGNRNRPLIVAADGEIDYESERASFLLGDMQDALEVSCPPFVYFGAHPGDGADFGFWPDWEALDQAMFQKYGEPLILDVRGEETLDTTIIQVRDHGNVTVMDMDRNVLWTTT